MAASASVARTPGARYAGGVYHPFFGPPETRRNVPRKGGGQRLAKKDSVAEENASSGNGRPLVANGHADVGANTSFKKKLSSKYFENCRFLTGRS
jgi:hypothetical protein